MGGVIGGVNAALPEAFDPPQPRVEVDQKTDSDRSTPSSGVSLCTPPESTSGATFTAEFPSDTSTASEEVIAGNFDVSSRADGAAVAVAAAAFRAAVDSSSRSRFSSSSSSLGSGGESVTMIAALLPLLARLPPICPGPRLTTAVPSLLLLAVRILGAVCGRTLGFAAAGLSGVSGSDGVGGPSSTMEAEAAIGFVRSCVRQVWLHGNLSQQQEPSVDVVSGEAGASAAEGGVAAKTEGVSTASSGVVGENTMTGASEGVAEQDGNKIDDDDWGDDDFQGAEGDFQGADGGGGDDDDTAAAKDSSVDVETEQEEAPTAVEGSLGDTEPAEEAGEDMVARDDDSSSCGGTKESEAQKDQGLGAESEEAVPPSAAGAEDDGDAYTSVGSSGSISDRPVGADASGSASGSADVVDTTKPVSMSVEGNEEASAGVVVNSPETLSVGEGMAPAREETENNSERGVEEAKETLSVPDNVEDCGNQHGASGVAGTNSADGGVSDAVVSQKEEDTVVDKNIEDGAESTRGTAAGTTSPPFVIADALSLVLAAGRAVNELLSFLLSGQGVMNRRAAAIGAAAEAWGAIALAIPQKVDELAEPLRAALTAPVEKCSVATRLALLHAVAVTVKAAAGGIAGEDEAGAVSMTSQHAAAALLRLLAPHALAGVRLEVDRAASAASASATAGGSVGVVDEEPREACLLKGVHVAQLAFMVSIICLSFGGRGIAESPSVQPRQHYLGWSGG